MHTVYFIISLLRVKNKEFVSLSMTKNDKMSTVLSESPGIGLESFQLLNCLRPEKVYYNLKTDFKT